jgi:hypothetical protein
MRRASVAAVASLVGAVVSVAAAIRRRRRAARAVELAQPAARRRLFCTCGREYEAAGIDRHRVYWPAGAPESEPVLGDDCPSCGERLPAEREGATAMEGAQNAR